MTVFNIDLDNTLIYHHARDIGKDKYCVEIYMDREQSFTTYKSKELLSKIMEKLTVVPTTTRQLHQYLRVDVGLGTFKYALISNGGKLMIDGKEDEEWYEESKALVIEAKEQMELAKYIMEEDQFRTREVEYIDELFLFSKTTAVTEKVEELKSKLDLGLVDVNTHKEKLYVVPKAINKGVAIKRLADKISADYVIAAGDSAFDYPMIEVADIGFLPKDFSDGIYSDMMLEKVLEIVDSRN